MITENLQGLEDLEGLSHSLNTPGQ